MTSVIETPEAPAAFHRINVGTNEDGRARTHFAVPDGVAQFHHEDNADDEAYTAFYQPHYSGSATMADGTTYDVGNDFTLVKAKHVGELDAHIVQHFQANGHPLHATGDVFVAEPGVIRFGPFVDPADAGGTMANASSFAENAALDGLNATSATNVIPDVSLHTASPGTTGASENANAGSYARQACTWNAASAGAKTNSTALTFTTAGTTAVTAFGTWSSATYGAGNYALGGNLTSSVTAVTITIASGAISISIS